MKRALAAAGVVTGLAWLAGCSDDQPANKQVQPAATATAVSSTTRTGPALSGGVTPNKDRIATIGLLNKRNNLTQDLVLKVGDRRRVGNVVIILESCERTAPWERPEEIGAFVRVLVEEPPAPRAKPQWRRVFSGWLFKNSPALNVVEHPVYDVWVKNCAMNFPGEESALPETSSTSPARASRPSPTPTPAASPSAANASGNESAASTAE